LAHVVLGRGDRRRRLPVEIGGSPEGRVDARLRVVEDVDLES